MNEVVVIKSLIQDLLLLVDKGETLEISTIKKVVYNGELVSFLQDISKEYAKQYEMYLIYIKDEEISYINKVFHDYVYAYDGREERKLGISNNGLVLLVLYAVELIRDLGKEVK